MKPFIKSIIRGLINKGGLLKRVSSWSLRRAQSESDLKDLVVRLREIVPDISKQEESEKMIFNDYVEIKRRTLQAFQCRMMLHALNQHDSGKITVVDIGDSAGTHMLYLKALIGKRHELETISVNLDPRAIEKIKERHLKAILCRAEDLDLGERKIDMFTSFEMVEHLHNPALFLHRLAVRSKCGRILITVPYRKHSTVGLYNVRKNTGKRVFAEDEHIFELSPGDWTLLFLHSGWKVRFSETYFQYPRKLPIVSLLLSRLWRNMDFEGFWGAILEKEMSVSQQYQDWEE